MPHALIVDADLSVQRMLIRALRALDLDSVGFDNGANALRWLEHHHPALLSVELALPDMSGLAVCAAVRGRAPIIVASAQQSASAHVIGAVCLEKPFPIRAYVEAAAALLERSLVVTPATGRQSVHCWVRDPPHRSA